VDSPCETVNFLGTRTPQITVQHDLAGKLILLLGFVLLLYMLLMYVVLIVNTSCDDELDICRKFHEFNLQGIGIKGKKLIEEQVNELKSFSESLKVLPTALRDWEFFVCKPSLFPSPHASDSSLQQIL
jgi:hypothetical protein